MLEDQKGKKWGTRRILITSCQLLMYVQSIDKAAAAAGVAATTADRETSLIEQTAIFYFRQVTN